MSVLVVVECDKGEVKKSSLEVASYGSQVAAMLGTTATAIAVGEASAASLATLGEQGITESDLLVHDIHLQDPSVAFMLARMEYPDFPQPVGIFRAVERDTYEDMMEAQIEAAVAKQGAGSLEKLINSGDTWIVAG